MFIIVVVSTLNFTIQYVRDISHIAYFRGPNAPFRRTLYANAITPVVRRAPKMLILTLDTRPQLPYVQVHNRNLEAYCARWRGITYKFVNKCEGIDKHIHNVYWCKIFLVKKYLHDYDYVLWLDSDTFVRDFSLNILDLFEHYDSEFYAGFDRDARFINAGIFAFRNSASSKLLLNLLIQEYMSPQFQARCQYDSGALKGIWAQTCYEQGIMNEILSKYIQYVTTFPEHLFYQHTSMPAQNVFIQHLYSTSTQTRNQVFLKLEAQQKQ